MLKKKILLFPLIFIVLLVGAVIIASIIAIAALSSCGENGSINNPNENTEFILITKEELIEYLESNGLTDEFDGVDLDDFIREFSITSQHGELYHPEYLLSGYREILERRPRTEIMAKEIVNVDSTDEEYKAFVDAFKEAVGKEFHFLGTYEDDYFRGLDGYTIVIENGREGIYIGRTKNIDQYDIREGGVDGTLYVYLPFGDMNMRKNFCYSQDNKFFLIITSSSMTKEYEHELNRIFTEVTY